jgi:hypothetical protein
MTAEWYDLGQRLHAAATGQPVARLAGAPLRRTGHPVAVRARQAGQVVTVTAAVPGQPEATVSGTAALALLHSLGVSITAAAPRTLVTDDRATLPALLALARSAGPDGDDAATAAHLAWWSDRADFPGSAAVAALVPGCRTRWITGTTPDAERGPGTWRSWLGIPGDGCAAMLAMLDRLRAGTPLPLLDVIEQDDQRAWALAKRDHTDSRDWRAPDSAARAAIGLRSRCDTADLYQAALLADPLYRRRAVHTGHVVTGTAATVPKVRNTITVTCDRMDCRLRAGSDITGWAGSPADHAPAMFRGGVTDAAVMGGALVLTVASVAMNRPKTGDRVTLHPAAPGPATITTGRDRYMRLYATRRSWLTTGRTPAPARRDTPLDVIVAAAGGIEPTRD